MAPAWVLKYEEVTPALIGASRVGQIDDPVNAVLSAPFTPGELVEIDNLLEGK